MSLLSDHKLLSGRSALIGQGVDYLPSSLNPSTFEGALIQGSDKLLHYSVGDKWIAIAPVLSTLFDAGNAATVYTGTASIDLGGAQT